MIPALAKVNPGVKLPDLDIVVAHRSDGSGTTFCFTDYLSKVSPEWEKGPGRNASVKLAGCSRLWRRRTMAWPVC